MRIRRVGVVGAGTMGSGIAALLASVGVPVRLLDVVGERDRDQAAKDGVQRALKARPPAFMDPARAALIQVGNIEDDLETLADCDWVIEAIVEQLEPKRALFERLERIVGPEAIVATNTSGIPIRQLAEGRSEEFRRRFLGTHFFNPPRYLRLLELIPTDDTAEEVVATVEAYADRMLGKGTVRAKDEPGFIANRLGLYGGVQTLRLMDELGLTIDEVDALTGPLLGRPRSATFRMMDLSGLDIFQHVAQGLAEATGEDFAFPDWVGELIARGQLGEKTGAGFYRREGSQILTLDRATMTYVPQQRNSIPEVGDLLDLPLPQRLRGAMALPDQYGEFVRRLLALTNHYAAATAPALAYDITSIDRAMEWGYGWELGPFRLMDALGLGRVHAGLAEQGLDVPELLRYAADHFYIDDVVLTIDGAYGPAPDDSGRLALGALKREGRVLRENDAASVVDLGDGVVLYELHTKMNAIDAAAGEMLDAALELVDREGYAGLVLGNEHPQAFSAGANLVEVGALVQQGAWGELDQRVREFQRQTMALRLAPFPVVAAAHGQALGGGAELVLHADHVQAYLELAVGLVEIGVGLLPAGGGVKELLFRFSAELAPYVEADRFEVVRRAFMLIALGTTSGSAIEARNLGFLRQSDRITANRDRLLADAKAAVLALAPGYVAPLPRTTTALGRDGLGNLRYAIFAFREAGQASEHDALIAEKLAYTLCGGDGPPREVTEQDILDFEREAFLSLLGMPKTQERIAAMLKTGKPLRN